MRRWLQLGRRRLLGGVSGLVTAVTVAAVAFAAVTLRGPSSDQLMRDLAVIDRELALAERTLVEYRDKPLIAEQIELRIAVLKTTAAMLDQKRLSWLRGLDLIYRVDGGEVAPDRDSVAKLEAELADIEDGMITARNLVARSTNEVARNMALALEQVHLLTHATIRQRIALERLGLALPPPAAESITAAGANPQARPEEENAELIGALNRPASVR